MKPTPPPPPPPLPYDYEVEWIECQDGAFIDTGVVVNSENWRRLRIVYIGSILGAAGNNTWRVSGIGGPKPAYYFGIDNVNRLAYGNGSNDRTVSRTLSAEEYTSIHRYEYNTVNEVLKFEDEEYRIYFAETTLLNDSFYLMKWNPANTYFNGGKCKAFQIEDNGRLIVDYVPVVKDEIAYMYDRVSDRLIRSSGIVDFIAGPRKT